MTTPASSCRSTWRRRCCPTIPFQTLDISGVGQLVEMGVKKGRATRPDLKVGICGRAWRRSRDRSTSATRSGLDYVSCFALPGPGGPAGRGHRHAERLVFSSLLQSKLPAGRFLSGACPISYVPAVFSISLFGQCAGGQLFLTDPVNEIGTTHRGPPDRNSPEASGSDWAWKTPVTRLTRSTRCPAIGFFGLTRSLRGVAARYSLRYQPGPDPTRGWSRPSASRREDRGPASSPV